MNKEQENIQSNEIEAEEVVQEELSADAEQKTETPKEKTKETPKDKTKSVEELLKEQQQKNAAISLKNESRLKKTQSIA